MPNDEARTFFAARIEELADALYGFARRLTRNDTDAEDLVAESVARAWSSIGSLDDRSRFRPWIYRIVHNCFVSDYRKKSARPTEYSLDSALDEGTEDDLTALLIAQPDAFLNWWGNPEKAFANSLLRRDIVAALEALPVAFRGTIVLVNVEGLSYDEAAEVLGVPPGTVRSRMKRGRTLLQKALWQQAREAGLAVVTGNGGMGHE
jgi:RNA polymerase sigma-70 factor (ECF subfamily)